MDRFEVIICFFLPVEFFDSRNAELIIVVHSNAYYPPHTHSSVTTHLIRRGTFTITYPEDNAASHSNEAKKETFGAGDRIDVPAGKLHEVWIGQEGCEYVIGE
jgi:hypothetical protein